MKQVKFNKQLQSIYDKYWHITANYDLDNIYKVYNKPSYNKIQAFERCKKIYNEYNGVNLQIIGCNCQSFSIGFICYINNKKHFVYITKDYDKICCVD
jgi:hypothetical protein